MALFAFSHGYLDALTLASDVLSPGYMGELGSEVERVARLLVCCAESLTVVRAFSLDDLTFLNMHLPPVHLHFAGAGLARRMGSIVEGDLSVTSTSGGADRSTVNADEMTILSEGIADLLATLALKPRLQVRKCFEDGRWYVPTPGGTRSRFCSIACKNAFNYQRKSEAKFKCVLCAADRALDDFTGLAVDDISSVDASRKAHFKSVPGENVHFAPRDSWDEGLLLCRPCILSGTHDPAFRSLIKYFADDPEAARDARRVIR